jgi:hypothetical protein
MPGRGQTAGRPQRGRRRPGPAPLVDRIAAEVDAAPIAAGLDLPAGSASPDRDGRRLDRDAAGKLLRRALLDAERVAELPVRTVPLEPVGAGPRPMRRTLMYHVPGDHRSWRSLDAAWDATDYVAAQWVDVNACGGLTTRDDQTLKAVARARGGGVLPSLLTYSAPVNHRLLTDRAVSDNLIRGIVDYVVAEEYPGFDIDLEAIDPADRDHFSAFIADWPRRCTHAARSWRWRCRPRSGRRARCRPGPTTTPRSAVTPTSSR